MSKPEESSTAGRSTLTLPRRDDKTRLVKKPGGHEAFLKGLAHNRTPVTINLSHIEDPIRGVILHSDKYTLSVADADAESGAEETILIFKHSIATIVVPNRVRS